MTCSFAWDDAGLPAWGTAPRADFWLALEQNGPWGAKAFTGSRLDPGVGGAIEQASLVVGGRPLLIRRPTSHADQDPRRGRQVYLAGGLSGTPWLLGGTVADLEQVLALPWDLLATADAAQVSGLVDWLTPVSGGLLLVCANGRRDVCCAVRGRPIARALAELRPGRVWECTHTGGHRFAPTGLVLPSGQSLARLTHAVALAALQASDRGDLAPETFGPRHDRGRSHLEPAHAVAEAYVRELTGERSPDALTVTPAALAGRDTESDTGQLVEVTHSDGRRWLLRLKLEPHDDLPESCGKAAVAVRVWRASLAR